MAWDTVLDGMANRFTIHHVAAAALPLFVSDIGSLHPGGEANAGHHGIPVRCFDVKANNNLGQLLIRASSNAGLHLKNPLRVTAGARGRCLIR